MEQCRMVSSCISITFAKDLSSHRPMSTGAEDQVTKPSFRGPQYNSQHSMCFLRGFASFNIISSNSTCILVKGEWESHKKTTEITGCREKGEGDREEEREGRWRELERGRE